MRNTRALIAGLGTTGSLVAASACVFVVASAVIAFKGWPGVGLSNPVGNLFVNDAPRVTWDVPGSTAVATSAGTAAGAVAATPTGPAFVLPGGASGSPRTLLINRSGVPVAVNIPRGAEGGLNSGGATSPVGTPGGLGLPGTPSLGGGGAGVDVPAFLRGATGSVGSAVSSLGDQLGPAVGQVNPQLGNTAGQTGHGLGDTVTQTGKGVSDVASRLTGQHQ